MNAQVSEEIFPTSKCVNIVCPRPSFAVFTAFITLAILIERFSCRSTGQALPMILNCKHAETSFASHNSTLFNCALTYTVISIQDWVCSF